ncbi:MAG: glycosyltransferase family 2 protein [Burkholderiales bacterium]|nr:glycosyltransferase family 2 protein [Burkholderiales bacterium]
MAVATAPRIAVVVPSFRVSRQIMDVLARIGPEVARIFVVDDACPERTGDLVERESTDPRVSVLRHRVNGGVGAAMVTGYRAALSSDADIVVKVDGDGQMDPAFLPTMIRPIVTGRADYAKGNRFYDLELLRAMPWMRLFGNSALSLVNKVASGYWDVMDPTNGYTAIHRTALSRLPLDKLDHGYFFESDMLFRLYTIRAVVHDVPMPAKYEDETSSLRIGRVVMAFPFKYLRAAAKRMFYSYFLRDFNAATVQFLLAVVLGVAGAAFGAAKWIESNATGLPATSGTVMLAALPVLVAIQLLLAVLHYDIGNVPREPLQRLA